MSPGRTPDIGSPAPAFALRSQHGEPVAPIGAGRAVLLVFFPFAFSPICASELAELQESLPEFTRADVDVVAISCDPVYSLRAMADREAISLTLVSDFWPHGAVARSYGCFDEQNGAPGRSSFLIDAAGMVRWNLHHGIGEQRPGAAHLAALPKLS